MRFKRNRTGLERFRAKWTPVRVKKTRQNKRLERGSDSIRTDKTLTRRERSPAARNQQQMGCAIHELRTPGARLRKHFELVGERVIGWRTFRVPPGVRRKSTMKQIKTS